MQVVILVGGKGERLRPLTDNIPKPMVEVADKPFLEHLIILLKNNGINKVLFLAGYLGDVIKDYFGNGSKWDMNIEYSFEDKPMGTGGALRLAKEMIDEEFFLLFGDSYLPIDYRRMASEFMRGTEKVMLSVYDNKEDTNVPFNIILDKGANVVADYRKAKDNPPDFNYCDAGVLIVRKSVINLINENKPVSLEEVIYPRMIAENQLGFYISEDRFYDIGTVERLVKFEQYILKDHDYYKNSV